MKIETWLKKNITSTKPKRILITGANSGIGFEAAMICARYPVEFIFACRSEARAISAMEKIHQVYPDVKIYFHPYDQSSLRSIEEFASWCQSTFEEIDVLVCNAGVYHPQKGMKTEDGFPYTVGVNYLGCYALIQALMPMLQKKKDHRIIFVSSLTYHSAKIKDYAFLQTNEENETKAYGLSKAAIAQLFIHLKNQEKLKVTLMHPGISSTNIYSSSNNSFPKWFQKLAHIFLPLFTHSPRKACLGIVKLALDDSIENGTILAPRGPWEIQGFPKKRKLPKKLYKNYEHLIEETEKILKEEKKHA